MLAERCCALEKDAESHKVVLELKNREIHEARHQILDLHQKVQEKMKASNLRRNFFGLNLAHNCDKLNCKTLAQKLIIINEKLYSLKLD